MLRRKRLLSSPRLRKKRRKVVLRKALFAGGILGVVVLAGVFLLNSDSIAIKNVRVVSAEPERASLIGSLVEEEIRNPKLGVIPKNNFIFLDQMDLAAAIKKAFPEIGLVRTRFNTITELVVEVKEREAAGLWCSKAVSRGCLYIDLSGLAFKEVVGEIGSTTLVRFKTDERPGLNKYALGSDKLNVYNKFIKVFETSGLKVMSVSDYGSDVYFELSDGAEIRARSDDDPEVVVGRLTTVYESLAKETKKTSIDYLDLRFGSKVFLKRK